MRRGPPVVFQKQGSQEGDSNVKVQGDEFLRAIKLFENKPALIAGIFFTVCAGGAPLLMNVVIGDMMTVMTTEGSFVTKVTTLALTMVYVVLGMAVITSLGIGFRVLTNPFYMVTLRQLLYSSLLELDVEYFDATPTGVLIGRLSEDVTLVRETYLDKGAQVMQSLAQAIAGLCLAFATSWRVALVCCPAIPLSAITFVVGEHLVDKLWLKFNAASSACISKAEEVIMQFRTVKAFDCEVYESDGYTNGLKNVDDVYKTTSWVHGIKDGLIAMYIWGMLAGLLYYTCWLMVRKPFLGVESGDMMVLMMSMMLGTMGISSSLSMLGDFQKAGLSAAKVLEIMEKKPKYGRHVGARDLNGAKTIAGRIEFKDVGFRYATRESWAVRHLDFVIEPGETVAFVGESGCGKSTTLQLLQRFYEVEEGEILIDGVPIQSLAPMFVRSQIATVPQGPVLFSMSIRDNLRYARPHASDTEVAAAARTGNAHDFIMEQPNNYETVVQQTSLSGGQKQRICISRAILIDAPILLLDEATAALDTESEQLVQQSLEVVRHGKTAVLVAHRLATVIHADRILVFKEGKVAETGKHEELLAVSGIYADLVKYQLE
jgi:ABC-type multidrug transport system fused ATPase/permease subunit